MQLFGLLSFVANLLLLSGATYVLEDDYTPSTFFSMFNFVEARNPVNGFAKYIDEVYARSSGLISQSQSSVYIGVDHNSLSQGPRLSVKLMSKKFYNKGLIILDIAHMPEGCGTWPAFWTSAFQWPKNGEIDVIEGVNNQAVNSMTLHTSPGCSIANTDLFSGSIITPSCYVHDPHQPPNAGCTINAAKNDSYGAGLNAAGGGVYATQWTSRAISIFFFPRGSIPDDIVSGSPTPQTWGKPLSLFQGHCNIDNRIKNQRIILNTAFCVKGPESWGESSCAARASSCHAFVQNNPSAFANAFWTINSLRVYQDDDAGRNAATGLTTSIILPLAVFLLLYHISSRLF